MTQLSIAEDAGRGARSGWPLPKSTLLGFLVAVLAVVLIAVLSYASLRGRTATAQRLTQTLRVVEHLEALMSDLKDAESAQRGFVLTGLESYLQPYTDAKAAIPGEFRLLRQLTGADTRQHQRLEALEQLSAQKMSELGETIDMQQAATLSSAITWGGSALLLLLIASAALMAARDHRAREVEAWLRAGQMGLSLRLQGEQRLDQLAEKALTFLAAYLEAQVGAVYIAEKEGHFQRVAGHALDPAASGEALRPGDGLLGQAAKERRPVHVRDLPSDYFSIASSTGRASARELIVAPASHEGSVQAVLELGFFRTIHAQDHELLARVSETLGIAVRAAKDRSRLEALLAETQRQAEELQAQQEELRVNNEELEEQGRALKESQWQLERQQAELEQTNSHLEEQTQQLESQRDELAEAQAVLTDKAAELARANQYKSEFLANMSHELRTPLNSTLILAKLLADNQAGNLSDEQVKFAQTISSAGNDLLVLINDILDLSKIEAGKVEMSFEPVHIGRAVDGLIKGLQPVAQQKGLALNATIEPGTPERLESDVQRLSQVLKNLLSNALKFTERGEVSLQVFSASEGTVSFAVRDTGIGIAPHQQEIIFEAFRQADGSTHRKYGGTGLGLSISRDLAHLLGGHITVQSAPGEGSVFTLTLPTAGAGDGAGTLPQQAKPQADAPPHAAPPVAKPALAPASPRALTPIALDDDRAHLVADARLILVIEDDTRFAAILRDLSHEMGFQCVITHSAGEGLAAAVTYQPSAILLDVNLPDHSGLGVLDQLKRNPQTRHIPVHMASVADYRQEARELGAVGYALKPVKREQLVEALKTLEAKFMQGVRRVLVVEDDARQRDSLRQLLGNGEVLITDVENAAQALRQLQSATFDCMVMDLNLPDLSGYELLERMAEQGDVAFPPVIVYTGRSLSRDEEQKLRRFSKSIIIKDARSPERLLDEVTLFLHQVEAKLPAESQRLLKSARDRETALDGRRVLVVEDDVRNIFALSSVLEPKGIKVEIARNGREALEALDRSTAPGAAAIDLVLMDIMMPEMDGFTAMREIRKQAQWGKLPIIALTAKAMKDDQEKCHAAGANDYIAKPLDVEKLLSLVRVWMPR
ncbi:MAG: response regulator [Rubrivivax sp.]|nr:MAG: response regulator [Rubrivivax sp.]